MARAKRVRRVISNGVREAKSGQVLLWNLKMYYSSLRTMGNYLIKGRSRSQCCFVDFFGQSKALDVKHESRWRLGWEEFGTGLLQMPRLVGSLCWCMRFGGHRDLGSSAVFRHKWIYTQMNKEKGATSQMLLFLHIRPESWDSQKSKIVLLWQSHLISIQNHVYLVQCLPFDGFWFKILILVEETLTWHA